MSSNELTETFNQKIIEIQNCFYDLPTINTIILFGGILCILNSFMILPLWYWSRGRNYYVLKKSKLIKMTFPNFPACTKIRQPSGRLEYVSYKTVSNVSVSWRTRRRINNSIKKSSDHEVDSAVRWLGKLSHTTPPIITQKFLDSKIEDEFTDFLRRVDQANLVSSSISEEIGAFTRCPSRKSWREYIQRHRTFFLKHTVPLEVMMRWTDYIGRGTSIGLLIGALGSQVLEVEIWNFISTTSFFGAMVGGALFYLEFYRSRTSRKKKLKDLLGWYSIYIVLCILLTIFLSYLRCKI